MATKYRPRKDFVLYRIHDTGKVNNVFVTQRAQQGKRRVVEAIGPDVEDLKVGDVIMPIGSLGQELVSMPEDAFLILTRESNLALVVIEEEKEELSPAQKIGIDPLPDSMEPEELT